MGKKSYWTTFVCKCGARVEVTVEVGDKITLFEGICRCGRGISSRCPERVLKELKGDDHER